MNLAPIQLKKYFITQFNLTALKNFDRTKPHMFFKNLQHTIVITNIKGQPGTFQVSLTLKHAPQPNENLPYSYSIQIVGFFSVDPRFPKDKTGELIQINGPAVLYGTAREILVQVSSRGYWGPIILPTVNFIPNKDNSRRK
jgi:preprotein translocase subunit SecB